MTRLLLFCIFAITSTLVIAEPQKDPEQLEAELRTLEAEIQKFREMMEETQGTRSDLEDTLRTNDQQINEILKKIETIQKDLNKGEEKISSLKYEQNQLQRAKRNQQELIARQIRAAYEIGNQEYLKVVLNQEDPNQLARMLTYYDYFNRARAEQIETFKETIHSLEKVSQQIRLQNEKLEIDRLALASQRTDLETTRKERRITLAQLNAEIARTGSEIDRRIKDRERLEALLERITAGVFNVPTPLDVLPFADRKGKLAMPVAGQVTNRFGSSRNEGKLRWNGILIAASAGDPVRAVHYGRVVFSDWLRGFGLLLIINHGDGYMSLYGHNQVLYRETGDWVTAGETIATVGNSGGQNDSGLYFEIRHAGTPADPQVWCRVEQERTA
jgi:septal ring factor EnvC (AmiA/AmiB activator)